MLYIYKLNDAPKEKYNLMDINKIKSEAPHAWNDFLTFYSREFKEIDFLINTEFTSLPFEMQLGIYLKYFRENGVELDVCNADYEMLPEVITEAFQVHEKVISHYS